MKTYILGLKEAGLSKTSSFIESVSKNKNLKKYNNSRDIIEQTLNCFLKESNKKFGKETTANIHKLIEFNWNYDEKNFFQRVLTFLSERQNKLKIRQFSGYKIKDFLSLDIDTQYCILCSNYLLNYEIRHNEIEDILRLSEKKIPRDKRKIYDTTFKKLICGESDEFKHIRNGIAHGHIFLNKEKLQIIDFWREEVNFKKCYSKKELEKKTLEMNDIRICFLCFLVIISFLHKIKKKFDKQN